MIGVVCEGCGKTHIDSGDTCTRCGRPKSAFALEMQRHYRTIKDVLPASLAEVEINIAHAHERFGGSVPKEYIERLHSGLHSGLYRK